jgi:hypothetical protein
VVSQAANILDPIFVRGIEFLLHALLGDAFTASRAWYDRTFAYWRALTLSFCDLVPLGGAPAACMWWSGGTRSLLRSEGRGLLSR